MRGQIPHRHRYRMMRPHVQSHLHSHQAFFNTHWHYRQQTNTFVKRPLGFGLSLIPYYHL